MIDGGASALLEKGRRTRSTARELLSEGSVWLAVVHMDTASRPASFPLAVVLVNLNTASRPASFPSAVVLVNLNTVGNVVNPVGSKYGL